MNILIIISLSISVFSLTVAFFMYLALLTLKQQNDTIIKETIKLCDSANNVITQNLRLQNIVHHQYKILENLTQDDLPI